MFLSLFLQYGSYRFFFFVLFHFPVEGGGKYGKNLQIRTAAGLRLISDSRTLISNHKSVRTRIKKEGSAGQNRCGAGGI